MKTVNKIVLKGTISEVINQIKELIKAGYELKEPTK